MINLAGWDGRPDCDTIVAGELALAGIDVLRETQRIGGEVPTRVTGRLKTANGDLLFARRWSYWSVSGLVPLSTARKLYATSVGRKDVRAAGDCTCPPPDKRVVRIRGHRYIDLYHIDSAEGLRLCCVQHRPAMGVF